MCEKGPKIGKYTTSAPLRATNKNFNYSFENVFISINGLKNIYDAACTLYILFIIFIYKYFKSTTIPTKNKQLLLFAQISIPLQEVKTVLSWQLIFDSSLTATTYCGVHSRWGVWHFKQTYCYWRVCCYTRLHKSIITMWEDFHEDSLLLLLTSKNLSRYNSIMFTTCRDDNSTNNEWFSPPCISAPACRLFQWDARNLQSLLPYNMSVSVSSAYSLFISPKAMISVAVLWIHCSASLDSFHLNDK